MDALEPELITPAPAESQRVEAMALSSSEDVRLVKRCLEGDEAAWVALLDRYRRLIYSIPIKYSLSTDQAADIFQEVCVELVAELPRLRDPRALPKWLIQVTAHKCCRAVDAMKHTVQDSPQHHFEDDPVAHIADPSLPFDTVMLQAEREQHLREAVAGVGERCRRLIHMLFYEKPPRPYREVADTLALASGSIGFIRGRCLARLRKTLEAQGLR